jgi:hypothetical protein
MLMVMLIKLIVARGYVAQFPLPPRSTPFTPPPLYPHILDKVGHCLGLKVKQSQEREWSPRSETNTHRVSTLDSSNVFHAFFKFLLKTVEKNIMVTHSGDKDSVYVKV